MDVRIAQLTDWLHTHPLLGEVGTTVLITAALLTDIGLLCRAEGFEVLEAIALRLWGPEAG
jgi:hypothetical protein